MHMKHASVNNHHFSGQFFERPEPKIAVLPQRGDVHCPVTDALDQGNRCGYPIEPVAAVFQILRKRPQNDLSRGISLLVAFGFYGPPKFRR
jgi:hypothetical protein